MILFNKPLLSISNNKKQCISVLNPAEFTVFVLYYHLASKFNLLIAIFTKISRRVCMFLSVEFYAC